MCVCLFQMCVCPICVSVPHVYLLQMCVCPNAFLVILQLLYLPPPKGEEKAAEGGQFASKSKNVTVRTFHICLGIVHEHIFFLPKIV